MRWAAPKRDAGRTSQLANLENRAFLHVLPVARKAAQSLHPRPHKPEALRPVVSYGPPTCDANDAYYLGLFCTSQRMQNPLKPA